MSEANFVLLCMRKTAGFRGIACVSDIAAENALCALACCPRLAMPFRFVPGAFRQTE